jgi:glycosyltransferase involved in cell wall biosynthesis
MPELVRDGENGLLFHWDAGELARKIELLLDDEALRTRIGEAGRESVQGFRAEVVMARYAAAYRALAARR